MTFKLQADAGDGASVSMDFDYSVKYSPLKDKLQQEPPAGADIRDLNELIKAPQVTQTNTKVSE